MTCEQIERALVKIRQLATDGDDEAAHCTELALHSAFLDHVATTPVTQLEALIELRELARLVRSSREIVFRRGA